MTAQQRGLATALALVSVLHLVLLWGLRPERAANDGVLRQAPVVLARWLSPPAVHNPEQLPAPTGAQRPSGRVVSRAAAQSVERAPQAEVQGAAAPLVEPAAVAADTVEPVLRADGIQRAAREMARRKGLAELSDEHLGQQPVDAQAALGRGVASAARGDCLKGGEGGYANSGLGLLALPLLAVDLAAGRCR